MVQKKVGSSIVFPVLVGADGSAAFRGFKIGQERRLTKIACEFVQASKWLDLKFNKMNGSEN